MDDNEVISCNNRVPWQTIERVERDVTLSFVHVPLDEQPHLQYVQQICRHE